MESFIDNSAEILWYKDDCDYEANKVNDEVNSWKSDKIKEYIVGNSKLSLGDFLRATTNNIKNTSQFFGFINGELASTVVVQSDAQLTEEVYIRSHINDIKKNNFWFSSPVLSKEKAEKILSDNEKMNKGHDDIMFVIVNPTKLKKGYGTRVISSVKNNLDFFAPNSSHITLKTIVHNTNFSSRKIFEKNDFRRLNVSHGPRFEYFLNYFLDDMEK